MAEKDMTQMFDGFETLTKRKHVTSGKKVRATSLISMTQEEKERYTAFAKAHGMTMSSLVRIAIEKFIEKNKGI